MTKRCACYSDGCRNTADQGSKCWPCWAADMDRRPHQHPTSHPDDGSSLSENPDHGESAFDAY